MNSTRKFAVITGVLFIIATFAGPVLATAFTPDLTGTDYLTQFPAHTNQAAAGVLLWIISAFTSAGIAIALYPVLKERNAGMALGSVIFRALEAVFYMVGVVSLLSLLTLGQQFGTAGAGDRTSTSGNRQFVGERTRPGRVGGGIRLLRGCIYVLLRVLPITAHSPLAIGLRDRRDHP